MSTLRTVLQFIAAKYLYGRRWE